jgi:hypothetical protein
MEIFAKFPSRSSKSNMVPANLEVSTKYCIIAVLSLLTHYSVCQFFLKLVQVLENYSAGSKGNVYWGDSIIVAVAPSREFGIGLSKHQIKYKRRSFEADQNAGIFIHSLTQLTHSSHSCTHSLTHSRPHSLTHSLTPLWYQ